MRGERVSGWTSWICRICLLYSSVIVLNSVKQDITLGYSRLKEQETVMDTFIKHFTLSGSRAMRHSLFFGACPLAVDPHFECERQLFVDFVDRTVLLHSWTI